MRLRHLPTDSALGSVDRNGPDWRVGDVILADIWQAIARSKEPHPLLRSAKHRAQRKRINTPDRLRRLARAKTRRDERRAAIAAGEIT